METMDQKQKFNNVLWELFRLYRGAKEREGLRGVTLLDFSNAIPIPATTRSSIMPEQGPSAYIPSDAMLDKIARCAEKYGKADDVYEAAGRSPRMPSDPHARALLRIFTDPNMTEEDREYILNEARKRVEKNEEKEKAETTDQLAFA